MTKNFSPKSDGFFVPGFLSMKKHQYLITAVMMLLFALIGWLIGSSYKFKYEATSVLVTNLEIVEDTNIKEIMVDSQMELIRQLMYHPDITSAVLDKEAKHNNPLTLDQLEKKSVIERRLNSTLIKIRDTDPQIAKRIADAWAEAAYTRLSEAYPHAFLVSEAKWMITSIEDCQSDELVFETNFCQELTTERAEELINEAKQVVLEEDALSLGLTKEIQISQYQPASLPSEPVAGSQSNTLFVGALAGFLLSLILYELPVFKTGDKNENL